MQNKREQRRLYKKRNRVVVAVEEHISRNKKEYIIMALIFIIGTVIGVMLVNCSSRENKESIAGYINYFVQSIQNKEYTINGGKLIIKSIISNLKIAVIIWIAGSTIIGIPIIYGIVGYKGLCVGYSISAIVAVLGRAQGSAFALITIISQNIITIPCVLALAVSSIKLNDFIMKIKGKDSLKSEIYRHTMFSIIMASGLVISSFLEYLFTMLFFSDIMINFI